MNTFPVMLGTLCVFALGYRYCSAFLAATVAVLSDQRFLAPPRTSGMQAMYQPGAGR